MRERELFQPIPNTPLPPGVAGRAPRRVLGSLWTYQKDAERLVAIIVDAPRSEELRLLSAGHLCFSEFCPNREKLLVRARILQQRLEASGWVRV